MTSRVFLAFFVIFSTFFIQAWCNNNKYDRSFTIFSDKGELLQVDFARKAGMKGETLLCGMPKDSKEVLLCGSSSKTKHALLDRRYVDKIMRVDDHIVVAFAGLAGDGRALTNAARSFCIDFHTQFGSKPSVLGVAMQIASIQHQSTLTGGKRPFGVQMLVIGVNEHGKEFEVYKTEPSGQIRKCIAAAIGKDSDLLTDKMESAWMCDNTETESPFLSRLGLSRLFSRLLRSPLPKTDAENAPTSTFNEYLDQYVVKYRDDGPRSVVIEQISEPQD